MTNAETVKLDIAIEISQHNPEYDTEITVADWNAMTERERSEVYTDAWNTMAQSDTGGIRVITQGAEEI